MSNRPAPRPLAHLACFALLLLAAGCDRDAPAASTAAASPAAQDTQADLIARGEYLVRVTGCNDCHTPGYAEQQGNVDHALWLTGSPLGYRGPWGTTYATNLRLRLADMDEAQWLAFSGSLRTRPIMPDFALRAMSEDDRRAMFHFIKSLGPGGEPAPAYLPPGQAPQPPYFELVMPAGAPATVGAP